MENLLYLKSGTDIRGTAYSEKGENIDLTDERIHRIIAALVNFLKKKCNKTELSVFVGYDSRVSSERIFKAATDALLSLNVNVLGSGLSSTTSMFMSVVNFKADAAIEITASHLPMEMNGLKFFTEDGGFSGSDIEEILRYAQENPYTDKLVEAQILQLPNMEKYSEGLREMIKKGVNAEDYEMPLKNLKIVVDAGNGVGAFYAYDVLERLGANIEGSRFLEPNGFFPNHIPNPENKVAMKAISQATVCANADLGVIFDTDCDRAACVDKSGEEINRNKLVALAAYIALKGNEGGTIVTDSVTSDGLNAFIENDLGGVHHRFKRGYKNVIDEAKRLSREGKNAPLAIETSGHAAFRENYFLDDGAYLITKIIIELAKLKEEGKSLNYIIGSLKTPAEEKEMRLKINLEDFKAYGNSVIADFKTLCENTEYISLAPSNYEGIRVNFSEETGDGWTLLRMSLHEPLLVVNFESNSKGGAEKKTEFFNKFISQYDKI